jgi:hypothetical protein
VKYRTIIVALGTGVALAACSAPLSRRLQQVSRNTEFTSRVRLPSRIARVANCLPAFEVADLYIGVVASSRRLRRARQRFPVERHLPRHSRSRGKRPCQTRASRIDDNRCTGGAWEMDGHVLKMNAETHLELPHVSPVVPANTAG